MFAINNKTTLLSARVIKTLLLSATLIGVSANSTLAKSSDSPINFAKGAISSTVTGKLKPNENERWYRFDASSCNMPLLILRHLLARLRRPMSGYCICQTVRKMAPKAVSFIKAAYPQPENIAYVSPVI